MKTIQLLCITTLGLALASCALPSGRGSNADSANGGDDGINDNPPPALNHDGSYASPISLIVGTAFSGKIGADGSVDQNSYYRFNTASGTKFELIVTEDSAKHPINGIWTQLSVTLNDDDESNSTGDRLGYLLAEGLRPVFENLAANKNYTIILGNDSAAGTYKLKVAPYTDPNEGTAGAPQSLNLDVAHHGTASNVAGSSSYFKFNTGTSGTSIKFDFDVHGLTLVLYSGSDFSGSLIGNNSNGTQGSWTVNGLTLNTDYYLELRPGSGLGGLWAHSVDYTLTLSD